MNKQELHEFYSCLLQHVSKEPQRLLIRCYDAKSTTSGTKCAASNFHITGPHPSRETMGFFRGPLMALQ